MAYNDGGELTSLVYAGSDTETITSSLNGQRIALRTNAGTIGSQLSYLLADVLGSSTIALTSSGATVAVQLFAPYGSSRYSQGTMPTSYNFTGQRLDSLTGLLYDNFRYYGPVSGRFTRSDTVYVIDRISEFREQTSASCSQMPL